MEVDWVHLQVFLAVLPSAILLLYPGFAFWTRQKFAVHRLGGLCFLIQWGAAWYMYLAHYDWYQDSFLIWSLPLNGVCQALSASLTFTFLSTTKDDPGYYGDRGTISYAFVVENIFYQLMTLFGSLYYSPDGYRILSTTPVGQVLEAVWVFLPFVIVRPFFPTTHFRDALKTENDGRNKTDPNKTFFRVGTHVIRVFYVLAKHFMGYYMMYLRFVDGIQGDDVRLLQYTILANCGTVSVSVFLHTLRFKRVMPARVTYSLYVIMAYMPFIGVLRMYHLWYSHGWILVAVAVGCALNFAPKPVMRGWQIGLMVYFIAIRYGFASPPILPFN